MNAEQWLKQMSEQARREPAPPVDVSDRVVERLRLASSGEYRPVAILACASGAAAVIVLAHAISAWVTWQDPITHLFVSSVMVLQ